MKKREKTQGGGPAARGRSGRVTADARDAREAEGKGLRTGSARKRHLKGKSAPSEKVIRS